MASFRVPVVTLFVLLVTVVEFGWAALSLGKYTVNRTLISTSGYSSGAAMATQLHVAYSSVIMGVGMIGGNPYYCAQGSAALASGRCMDNPGNIVTSDLTTQTTMYASNGEIDLSNNMYNSMVFILAGTLDTVVLQGVGKKVEEYYRYFVNPANIKTVYTLPSEHTFPTVDYGNDCNVWDNPYLSRCSYDGAFEILNHTYGALVKPAGITALPGLFYEFDQSEFIALPNNFSMDSVGYVYVPSQCLAGTACRLHVALHGCSQGRYSVGDQFARKAGYNDVGELNNIIILYPQAIAIDTNQLGCWDWWGYTTTNYATKNANQTLAIWRMIERIAY